jgi:hypothetical protein
MDRPPRRRGAARRRGVILLVVIVLLTLFAAVGLAFVLYADAEANAARVYREAGAPDRADVTAEAALAFFLPQLIYDVDDTDGVSSALRGHSLARLLYGSNDEPGARNDQPFNGTGRLHAPGPLGGDDYRLINYTYFPGDGFLRDPERLGWRAGQGQPRGPYTGGFNPPYTYPDLNNVLLAAVKADGTVLTPSGHRHWLFNPGRPLNDRDNPNWTNAEGKYLTLRPREFDQRLDPGVPSAFPYPEDAGGDVKNLVGAPGGNDSVWIDLGAPVRTAPDGRKFKMLFAPLVCDLDNRVNLNVHGNARGAGAAHRSNQGWGPWEVNPGRVLDRGDEWAALLVGRGTPAPHGRYGPDGTPASPGTQAPPGPAPHSYAQVDFDGADEGPGGAPTGPPLLPGSGAPPFACFPAFPPGYGNRSGDAPASERWEHPLLGNPFRPAGDDRPFRTSDTGLLLLAGVAGGPGYDPVLSALCPGNFADARRRRLVTTASFDLDRPGVIPWLFDRDASAYRPPLAGPDRPPAGPPIPFPDRSLRATGVPANSEFRTPGAAPGSPDIDWRSADAALGRVDLNRFLPPYPHQGQGLDPDSYRPTPLVGPGGRFDAGGPAVRAQFLAAQAARQQLADDIYRRLLAVTGVAAPLDPARPTDDELVPRRWLAQLAVNVVDFLDEDEVSTPFNFYTAGDAGALSLGNPELPRYWVFGTELPRVVLNEVLTEYQLPRPRRGRAVFPVRVWAELFNPLPAGPLPPAAQQQDALPVPFFVPADGPLPGYAPYKIILANTNTNAGGPLLPRPGSNDNVLGIPDITRAATDDADFAGQVAAVGGAGPAPPSLAPQGFFLLGPPGADARNTIAPPRVPAGTPWLQSPHLEYAVAFTVPNTWVPDDRPGGITVLLRRLANPHLPHDPRPALAGLPNPAYNPYLTVDYLEGVPLNDATGPRAVYASRGKLQPYAADPTQVGPEAPVPGSPTWHTLGRRNDPAPPSGHYDWLVHLDRQPVSPPELLQVAGCAPPRLTHRFISPDAPGGPPRPFNHLVPWFDEGNRLYRVFEYLQAHDRLAGVVAGGRVPAQVNLNTVWDPETLRALCDPQPGNQFTAADVDAVFARLLALRTPDGTPGPDDRPFLGMAVGVSPAPDDPEYPGGTPPLFPRGSGINDTLFRSAVAGGGPDTPRLFQPPGASHPYLRAELLTKIANHVTTRSNVFSVWCTVGFFEVTDDTAWPVKLGAEIGRAEGRAVRHRFFAIVDRTNLSAFGTTSKAPASAPAGPAGAPAATSGTADNGRPWRIQPGSVLVIDAGEATEETVVVTEVTPTSFAATFRRPHPAGFTITGRGNPGPWPDFNPRAHPDVVPYVTVIE